MTQRIRFIPAAMLIAVLLPSAARAQFGRDYVEYMAMQSGGRPAVSAVGTAVVKRNPTRMRMYVQLFGKGKTPEEALAKLSERREAAALELESLKADKKSVVFGDTSFSTAQEAVKQRLEAMIREQMRVRGKAPKGLKIPQSVTVVCTLSVEWPLEADSQEKLLLKVHEIQERIKAADISGGKEAEKLSPEEEELAEEAKELMNRYDEQPPPLGQPAFLFVAEIAKADRDKAMAEAYVKANRKAADLARAAGAELGELIGLSGGCGGGNNFGEEGYSRYSGESLLSQLRGTISEEDEGADGKPGQAMSVAPGPLTFKCYVAATYSLGKKP